MSECKLDHSLDDVKKKLEEQTPFLHPQSLQRLNDFLSSDRSQVELNEVFHLLKKYDLSSQEEQARRDAVIQNLPIA